MLWLFLAMRCSSQYSLRFVLYSFVYVFDSKFSRFFLYSFVYLLDSKFLKICLVFLCLRVGFKVFQDLSCIPLFMCWIQSFSRFVLYLLDLYLKHRFVWLLRSVSKAGTSSSTAAVSNTLLSYILTFIKKKAAIYHLNHL